VVTVFLPEDTYQLKVKRSQPHESIRLKKCTFWDKLQPISGRRQTHGCKTKVLEQELRRRLHWLAPAVGNACEAHLHGHNHYHGLSGNRYLFRDPIL
jgi:hypothetical protein